MRKLVLTALISLFFGCAYSQKNELDNTFYAFNNSMRMPNAPEGMEAQAELIKRLGFDGFSGHINDDYFSRRAALDKVGLKMPEIYWGIDMDSIGKISYKEGLKIAIYPHVGNYCETSEHSVRLAKMVNRPNVGAIFNTCHLLKVEGEEGWEKKLIDALPYLFIISINGADSGNAKEMNWDKLIQPLGEGTFDTYKLVKLAKDNGYKGFFGLQCYDIKQDCVAALTKSINTWNACKKRYASEKYLQSLPENNH